MDSVTSTAMKMRGKVSPAVFGAVIYMVAFVTGAIVMSFEMLGSRYLNPYFGSGIYTWAALISTVLAALTAGYFLGGFIADRTVSATVLGRIVGVASVYLLVLPSFADAILRFVLGTIDNVRLGSLYAALAIMFLPVMLLGVYSPFAIRLVLRATQQSGTVSGTVYGVSTAGSIAGTLGTTFFLIPTIGTHTITLWLGAIGIGCGLSLFALDRAHLAKKGARSTAGLVFFAVLMLASNRVCADNLINENVRAEMLNHSDGHVAHLETEYNDLFIDKHGSLLGLSSRYNGRPDYIESVVDLKDPDAMPVPYNQIMPVALAYPQETKRILMIGLGAGSISTYLGRAMPDAQIDVVELDPGVIAVGKQYFGLRETDKVRFIESDGRVYLNRHKHSYDLILLDAFRELGVPFHMLTREFYALVKEHLAPGGAVASNVVANTKLYLSTLVTLRAVFPTVDVYPAWSERNETQAIAVAVSAPRPASESLMQRALALQAEYRFRYPLPALVGKRVTELYSEGADVLTDDFAPADLYRVTPIGVPKHP
jgi:predicted membrane-bound spermidine synthase